MYVMIQGATEWTRMDERTYRKMMYINVGGSEAGILVRKSDNM